MPPGDSGPRNQQSRRPSDDENQADRTDSTRSRDSREQNQPSGDSVDFGSFVSSTVRSSSELFGTPSRSSRRRTARSQPVSTQGQPQEESAQPRVRTERPEAERPVTRSRPSTSPEQAGTRPSRYWRDQAAPIDDVDADEAELEDDGQGGNRSRGAWAFGDGQRPSNAIIGGIVLLLLAIILIFWLLNRGGDDGGEDVTPTVTPESVIDPGTDSTPSSSGSTPTSFQPPTEEPAEPTATEGPRRGGDNQRDNDDEETPGASTGADPLADIELGPVAKQCPERCLVRIAEVDKTDRLLREARTRSSFSVEGWDWVVASPEGIAWLEQNTETTLVSESDSTLALYVARVPSEEANSDRVDSLGTVIDRAGEWRVFEATTVPANVRSLTDWGYEVSKMSPAPPHEVVGPEEPIALANVEIGALMDDVSSGNITSSIDDLVGFGTRYYTTQHNAEAAEYLYTRLEAYGLRVWYEDFLSWEGYLMVNVVGEVPGEDDSAIYGVMAHFDTISSDLSSAPGADDNATGISASLEIARVLSQYELVHPVQIIFVNVEEVGIVGSNQFAANVAEKGIPLEGVFNLDSVGAHRQYNYMVVNGSSETGWMVELYRRLNDAYGLGQVINAQTNDQIVADDNRLRDHGIDSIMIARELYGQSPYHHTPQDTVDTLRIEGVVSCAQLTLLSLAELARA